MRGIMLKKSLIERLEKFVERHEEIAALLNTQEVMNNSQRFTELSKEYAELSEIVTAFKAYSCNEAAVVDAEALMSDPEMRELAKEEYDYALKSREGFEAGLTGLLLPKDPNDKASIFLEIRAAAGGDESAIFAGDLFRMYSK